MWVGMLRAALREDGADVHIPMGSGCFAPLARLACRRCPARRFPLPSLPPSFFVTPFLTFMLELLIDCGMHGLLRARRRKVSCPHAPLLKEDPPATCRLPRDAGHGEVLLMHRITCVGPCFHPARSPPSTLPPPCSLCTRALACVWRF